MSNFSVARDETVHTLSAKKRIISPEFCLPGDITKQLYCIIIDETSGKLYLRKPNGELVEIANLDDVCPDGIDNQEWLVAELNKWAVSYNSEHGINNFNIANVAEKSRFNLFPNRLIDDIGLADTWVGFTMDHINAYITLYNIQTVAGVPISGASGLLMAVDRTDGSIRWQRTIESYSGVPGDFSRSAVAIVGDRLYFGTTLFIPQVWNSTIGSTDGTVYGIFNGAVNNGRGDRPGVGCVNKCTGDLIWYQKVGKVAQKIDDEDNMIMLTQSPYPVTVNGIVYIAIGTSSAQSFIPSFYSRSPLTIFGGAIPIYTNMFRATDMGKTILMRASDGAVVKEISVGPPIYKAGQVMDNSLSVEAGGGYLRPATTQMKIRHFTEATDVAATGPLGAGGVLASATTGSNGEDQWIGAQRITWFMEERAGNNAVPGPLNAEVRRDNQTNLITLTGVNDIASKTVASPCVLTTSIAHKFAAVDVAGANFIVQVSGDADIPDGSYIATAIAATTITITYDNTGGTTAGGGCVWGGKIDIVSTTAASPVVVMTTSDHGLAVGDGVHICGRAASDIPDALYTVTVVGAANTFEVAYDNTGSTAIGAGGYIALVDRLATTPVGRDAVVTRLLDASAFGIATTFTSGSLAFLNPTAGAYNLNSNCVNLLGNQGDGFNSPARMWKYIQDGDVLSDQDAYECSPKGASNWGTSPSIVSDAAGNDLEIYVSTGQGHHIDLDTMEAITTLSAAPRYIAQENIVKAAEDAFFAAPSDGLLTAWRDAINLRATNAAADRAVLLSPRANSYYFDSVVAINLRAGAFGDIIWGVKSQGYDTWHSGMNNFSYRSLAAPSNPTTPVDVPSTTVYPVFQWTDIQEYYGIIRGIDGDYGNGTQLFFIGGKYYLGLASKGGLYSTIELSDPLTGATTATPLAGTGASGFVVGGNPGIYGGTNLGACGDDKKLYILQVQSPQYSEFVLSTQTTPTTDYSTGMPQPFAPQTRWPPVNSTNFATIVPFEQQQSYSACYDIVSQAIEWEKPVIPEDTAPFAASVGCPSVSKTYLYACDGLGNLRISKKSNGELVKTIPLQNGGHSRPVLVDDDIYVCSGRQGIAIQYNTGTSTQAGANYGGTNFLFRLGV